MAMGERIRFFRNLKGLTQRQLGMEVGFPESNADVRLAQYETGSRTPKAELTMALARVLGVSARALSVPGLDSQVSTMHALFALEDLYGLTAERREGRVCLTLKPGAQSRQLAGQLEAWADMEEKRRAGEISREEYDHWRYFYPEGDR